MEKSNLKRYCLLGVIAAAAYLLVMHIDTVIASAKAVLSAAAPLLLGAVIAYVLNILLKQVEKYYFPGSKKPAVIKSRRPVCILLSLAILCVLITILLNLVVPELMSAIQLMIQEVPPTLEAVRIWAIDHSEQLPEMQESLQNMDIDWEATIRKALEVAAAGAGGLFSSVVSMVSGVFGTIVKLLIGTIFAIYLLVAKEKLAEQADNLLKAYCKPKTRERILYTANTVHGTFTSFIVGQCTEAVIIGALCALGMTFLRMPYAIMTGTVVGVTAMIPVVGAYIGAAVGAFMVFTVNPLQAVGFVVFLVILQQLEGNLIYPKVVGSSIGLPGMWVLAAVTIGGGLFGILGMLLGVPLAASAYKLLEADVERRIGKQK